MRYHNITKDDMQNGDGLRTVLWLAGCDHCCEGCHNPVTWDPTGGLEFDEKVKEELFEYLGKPYISGITFSGGDPLFMANRLDVRNLAREISEKFPNKTIWMYTGYLYEKIKGEPVMENVDILVDGPYMQDLGDSVLHWKGSSNQRVIDVKRTRKEGEIILWDNSNGREQ